MSNIVINKGTVNGVVATLSERSKLINPFYLFVFTSKFSTSKDEKKTSVQSSFSNSRYDLLLIEEINQPDALQGQIYLLEGEWSYKVYESETQTLNVEDTTGEIIQQGLIIVK